MQRVARLPGRRFQQAIEIQISAVVVHASDAGVEGSGHGGQVDGGEGRGVL